MMAYYLLTILSLANLYLQSEAFDAVTVDNYGQDYVVYYSFIQYKESKITVDLTKGSPSDMALHYDMRYDFYCGNPQKLLLNTRVNDEFLEDSIDYFDFPFFENELTSVFITAKTDGYSTYAESNNEAFAVDYPNRGGFIPSDVNRVQGYRANKTACHNDSAINEIAFSVGRSTLSSGSVVKATASFVKPADGTVEIDLVLGAITEKERLPVTLKVVFIFDSSSGRDQIVVTAQDGSSYTLYPAYNFIDAGSTINVIIEETQVGSCLTISGGRGGNIELPFDIPQPDDIGTIWITGASHIINIVYE